MFWHLTLELGVAQNVGYMNNKISICLFARVRARPTFPDVNRVSLIKQLFLLELQLLQVVKDRTSGRGM